MKLLRSLAALVVALALAFAPIAAQAQQPPNAYGTTGGTIVPNYYLLTGSYAKAMSTGTMAAGLAAASPIYAFRYGGTGIAVIRRVTLSAGNAGTGFAAGVSNFNLFAARAFTASDTGGTAATLTGNNAKLKTSFATTGVSQIMIATTATNTAGTRTLDTDPLGGFVVGTPVTANAALAAPGAFLFDPKNAGDMPLQLATNEGFVIQATVPATGTWSATVFVEWDEFSQY